MGLFDFLHGKDQESEAQAYMKKRNKEYAKRSAEYEKRERMIVGPLESGHTKTTKTLITKGGTNPDGLLANLFSGFSGMEEMRNIADECMNMDVSSEEKQAMLKQRLQEKYGKDIHVKYTETVHDSTIPNTRIERKYKESDDCEDFGDMYDNDKASIFEVNTVQAKGSVVKLCGKVVRGRFATNDDVCVNNGINQLKLLKIVRQGADMDYVNVSSGIVVLTVPKTSYIEIKPGDKIIKKKNN